MRRAYIALFLLMYLTAAVRADVWGTVVKISEKGFIVKTARGDKSFVFADHLLTGLPNSFSTVTLEK